jgi:hypothetical protein
MTLAKIPSLTFQPPLKPAASPGPRPEFAWIAIDKLRIDGSYQRDVMEDGKRNIRYIAENFQWSRFVPLMVAARPGGVFAVIDGQHRAAAAMCHGGFAELPCVVVDVSLVEEAATFAAINGRVTRMNTLQIFHAQLVAGVPQARALRDLCETVGVRVPRNVQACDKPGMTLAIGILQRLFVGAGPDVLGAALRVIVETGDGNAGLLRAPVIRGFCEALSRRPAWRADRQRLHAMVESVGVRALYTAAKRIQAVDGGPLAQHIAKRLLAKGDLYFARGAA